MIDEDTVTRLMTITNQTAKIVSVLDRLQVVRETLRRLSVGKDGFPEAKSAANAIGLLMDAIGNRFITSCGDEKKVPTLHKNQGTAEVISFPRGRDCPDPE